jgi:regulator of protease activity HflC (stomatin/prohibitin superfamily)
VTPLIIVLAVFVFLMLIYVLSGLKIVRPYQRGIVERLGKYKETIDPGLRVIIPGVERVSLVDMREQVVDVPPQEVITSDNVVVSVDAVIYYEATDAQRLI